MKTTIREGITKSTNASKNQRKQQNEDEDTTVNTPKFKEQEVQEEMDKVQERRDGGVEGVKGPGPKFNQKKIFKTS